MKHTHLGMLCLMMVSGCQYTQLQPAGGHHRALPVDTQAAHSQHEPVVMGTAHQSVIVGCEGGVGCTFIDVDGQQVPGYRDGQSFGDHQLGFVDQGKTPVRLQPAISISPGQHQLKLDFYPLLPNRAEQFKLIHDFQPGHSYLLKQYVKRAEARPASLLEQAAPDPLCIDLLEGVTVVRTFCRPHNAETGMGEFVEKTASGRSSTTSQ